MEDTTTAVTAEKQVGISLVSMKESVAPNSNTSRDLHINSSAEGGQPWRDKCYSINSRIL